MTKIAIDKTMRVLMAGHLFPTPANPGLGVFVLERAHALARHTDVSILSLISFFPLLRPKQVFPEANAIDSLHIQRAHYLALPRQLLAWRCQTMATAFARAARHFPRKPDIVHVDWLFPDACAVLQWARPQRIPVVVTIHGKRALGLPKNSRLYAEPLKHAHRIIAVSNDLKRQLLQRFPGLSPDKIAVIGNGVDPERFKPMDRMQARQTLGLPPDARLVINVARLSEEKAQASLVQAAAQMPDALFYILGDGPLRSTLHRQINQMGLAGRMRLAGIIEHERIPLWMAAADVLCLPSLHEGSPVTLYEALACGTPVVASEVGGIPEIVSGPEFGILVPPGDSEALASALTQALSSDWDTSALSRHGQSFTWHSIAEQTTALYRELLQADHNHAGAPQA